MEKNKLSKGILQMKFMQRSSHNRAADVDEEEEQQIDNDHWVLDIPDLVQNKYVCQTNQSYISIEQLQFGRMSYKGFNPEIEKIMQNKNTEQDLSQAEEREKELGVDDEEMADRYSSLGLTVGSKFKSKNERAEHQDEMEH